MRALGLGLAAALAAGAAAACPEPAPTLLFHSCWGVSRAEILLVPDEGLPETGRFIAVTGAYTAEETDTRPGGEPKPVGLFVHRGRTINPNLGRMDGVLIVDQAGHPSLHHRARVALGGETRDLSDPDTRAAFREAAEAAGASVLQSHLLIVDGVVDVRPSDDAPRFVRRMFFTDADGFGLYQTAGLRTLHEAAVEVAEAHAPRMALNLDMGSFDYCEDRLADPPRRCGLRQGENLAGLSNLLVLHPG